MLPKSFHSALTTNRKLTLVNTNVAQSLCHSTKINGKRHRCRESTVRNKKKFRNWLFESRWRRAAPAWSTCWDGQAALNTDLPNLRSERGAPSLCVCVSLSLSRLVGACASFARHRTMECERDMHVAPMCCRRWSSRAFVAISIIACSSIAVFSRDWDFQHQITRATNPWARFNEQCVLCELTDIVCDPSGTFHAWGAMYSKRPFHVLELHLQFIETCVNECFVSCNVPHCQIKLAWNI
jgi:hypothetical protein